MEEMFPEVARRTLANTSHRRLHLDLKPT